jgi:DNA-binding XRE family transcriptional regulator
MRLCNRLRERRNQQEWTQEALAQAVGVTRQTIIAVEQGKHEPSVRLALEIARALGDPLEDLFWLEEEATEEGAKK